VRREREIAWVSAHVASRSMTSGWGGYLRPMVATSGLVRSTDHSHM
jgi:hypothetical protein